MKDYRKVIKTMVRQGLGKPKPTKVKKDFTFEDLQDGMLAGIIIEEYEKQEGQPPMDCSSAEWFIWWHFKGGKNYITRMGGFSAGWKAARDFYYAQQSMYDGAVAEQE